MTTTDDAIDALADLGAQYAEATAKANRLRDLVKAAAVEADGLGVSRKQIIRLSRLSRPAAYDLFRETRGVKISEPTD